MWSPTGSLGREICSWTFCQRLVPSSVLMAFFPLFVPGWGGSLQGAPERPPEECRAGEEQLRALCLVLSHRRSHRGKTADTALLRCALGHSVMGTSSGRWHWWFHALIPTSVGPASNRWVKWRKNGAFFILINPAESWAFLKVCKALIRALSSVYYIIWLPPWPPDQLLFLATVPRQ